MIVANRRGEADLVTNLSSPLPVIVIAEMLGIPADRRDDFKRWSDDSMSNVSQMSGMTNVGSPSEMERYFAEIIEERKLEPRDDLISALVSGPETLISAELMTFCVLLLIAGNETTTNLISNATLAFFEYPEQEELVRSDHSLIPSAMEEALR
jgi:cytochrome P450